MPSDAETFRNPVLSGCYPDPSICRVGDDFYLVTSTFEYVPGVPVLHSRDLVTWRTIGHALTRTSQADLSSAEASKGIFAPVIRHHDGVLYMITTDMSGAGSFYVTTDDPTGEWSEPTLIRETEWSMDPSLLFDTPDRGGDGTVYYTRHGGGRHGGVYQATLDITTGELDAEPRLIWPGTGGIWPEGPHLYHVGDRYYLLISEGGTSYDHSLTVARSRSPWGPFEAHPDNPILTHRDRPDHPFQALGHADLVELADGSWWAVMLGIRPHKRRHLLGREVFLAPVTWEDGWPVINGGEPIEPEMDASGLPARTTSAPTTGRVDFTATDVLGLEWIGLRTPNDGRWQLEPGVGLRLSPTPTTIDDVGSPAFIGRRQQHHSMRAGGLLDFDPRADGDVAGLVIRLQDDTHHDLVISRRGSVRVASLIQVDHGERRVVKTAVVADGLLELWIDCDIDRYEFSVFDNDGPRLLGNLPTSSLAIETAESFTGVVIGLYASSSADPAPTVTWRWFDYDASTIATGR